MKLLSKPSTLVYDIYKIHWLIYSISVIRAALVTSPIIYVVIVVHADIQGKIVQQLAGSFCTGDVEFIAYLLSEIIPPTIWGANATIWIRITDGHFANVGWKVAFPIIDRFGKSFWLHAHS